MQGNLFLLGPSGLVILELFNLCFETLHQSPVVCIQLVIFLHSRGILGAACDGDILQGLDAILDFRQLLVDLLDRFVDGCFGFVLHLGVCVFGPEGADCQNLRHRLTLWSNLYVLAGSIWQSVTNYFQRGA